MKLTKRLIALLLAVLMLPVWNPTAAQALEDPLTGNAETGSLIGNVNPRYEGILTADDFQMPERTETPDADLRPNATFVSMTQAATQLRGYMKNRTEEFTMYVLSDSSDPQYVVDSLIASASVHNGNPKEGDSIQWHWGRWDAEYSRTWTGSTYQYTFDIIFAYYTTAAQEKKLDTAVSNLISSLGLSGKSDYQKVKKVYDYICANVTYDYDNLYDDSYTLKFSAYAALVNKTAVCQGYALLFYRLMLELGIDARLIPGIGGGGAHAWNIVELDGLYYNLDSTWDAGVSSYGYFLTNSWDFPDHYRYLEYETWEFHEEYPMAAENYTPGVAGEMDQCIFMDYCGDNAAFMVERDGTVTIGGTGATYDYTYERAYEGGAPWKHFDTHIKKLVVEEGITELGEYSFYGAFDNMKTVSLPDSLTGIGRYAFQNCDALTKITLPETLVTIDDYAFYGCDGLKTVTIPASVAEPGLYAFAGCANLTSVDLYCQEVGSDSFAYCEKLTDIYLSDNVTTLNNGAFRGCTALAEIVIPGSVTSLGDQVFEGCTALERVYFLGDCPEFSYYTFYENTLTAFYPVDNTTWTEGEFSDYSGDITWVPMIDAPEVKIANVASTGKIKLTWDAVEGAAKYKVYRSTSKDGTYSLLSTVKGTSLTHASAVAGKQYYYYVVALDSDGNPSLKSEIVTRTCDLPRPVVTLTNVASTGKIKISWEAIEDAVKYEVYRSTDNKNWTLLKTTTGTALNNTSTVAGTQYYYKVRAIASRSSANSAYSTVGSIYCDLPCPEITLSNVSSTGKIKVKWDAVADAVKYEVYRSADKETWTLVETTTGTSATDAAAAGGNLYYYKVKALAANSESDSAFSAVKSRYCDLAKPEITLSNVSSTGKIKIKWSAVEGAVKYQVYRSTDKVNWTRLITTTGTSLTNSSAEAGVLYYYKVRAISTNSGANSVFSDVKSRYCDLPRTTLTVTLNSKDKPYLTWTAVDGAVKYELSYSTDGGVTWTVLKTMTGTKLTHSSAVPGKTYSYRVRALANNSGANSAYASAQVAVPTTLAITSQPQSVTVAEGETALVHFEAQGDGMSFVWYYKDAGASEFTRTDEFTGNSYFITMTAELDGRQLYCVVTDQYGNTVQTEVVTISMLVEEQPEEEQPEEEVTEELAYERMIAMKEQYPEGMPWTNENYYDGVYVGGYGCVAFASLLSDAAFGDLPAREISENISIDMVRVGDILRVNGDTHSVIILEVHEDHIVIAEGNYNSSIHWGRTMTAEEVAAADYVLTRYPKA